MDVATFYGGEGHQSFTLGEGSKRALLLHGFPGTPAELRALAEALVAGGWQVRAPLLPGFGMDIARLSATRRQDWVEAAKAAWLELREGAETALLLGFSMGGAVALHVAAQAAEEAPDRLVLVAPFWRMADPRAAFLPLLKVAKPRLRPFQKADFSAAGVRARFQRLAPDLDLDDPEVRRALQQEVTLPTSAIDELRRLGAGAFRAAKRVTAPALVVQGRSDPTVTPRQTRRLILELGGPVTLLELPGDHEIVKPHGRGHREMLRTLLQHLSSAAAGGLGDG